MKSSLVNVIVAVKSYPTLVLLLGILVGLIIDISLILFKEFSAETMVSMNCITKDLGLTNLGIIDDINLKNIRQSAKVRVKHEWPTEMQINGKKDIQ